MFLNKLKTIVPMVLVAVGLLAGASVVARPTVDPSAAPKKLAVFTVRRAEPPAKVETKPLPKGPNKLFFYRSGRLTLIDPDGKNEQTVSEDQDKFFPGNSRLSPDGKKLAFLVQSDVSGQDPKLKLFVRGLTEKEPGLDLETACLLHAWSPDGTQIAITAQLAVDFVETAEGARRFVGGANKLPVLAASYVLDLATKKRKSLDLPPDKNHVITDWTRDGKYLLTTSHQLVDGKLSTRLHLMNLDGAEHKQLTDAKEGAMFGRMSPDGKRVLYIVIHQPKEQGDQERRELRVMEVATGKETPVASLPLNSDVQSHCWSPDGKRIAFIWREIHDGKPEDVVNKETESHLVVSDPDGKNQKTIASEKGQGQWIMTLGDVDWR